MPPPRQSRLKFVLLIAAISVFMSSLPRVVAQDDPDNIPLGDVARSLRNQTSAREFVIDNDNLTQVVDDAESRREAGLVPMLSFDPGYNSVKVSAPDVSCSLTFTAQNSSSSDQLLWNDLPRTELSKLEGPATIDGDTLEVALHNGTSWDLREVVIGLTIVRTQGEVAAADHMDTGILPSISADSSPRQSPFQKLPDTTILLRMKGSSAPSQTAIFRTSLNFALFPDQEWHWAIVKAKGIAPQTNPEAITQAAATNGAIAPPLPVVNGSLAPSNSPLTTGSSPGRLSTLNPQPAPSAAALAH